MSGGLCLGRKVRFVAGIQCVMTATMLFAASHALAASNGDGCLPDRPQYTMPMNNWQAGWYHVDTNKLGGIYSRIYNYSPWVVSGSDNSHGVTAWTMLTNTTNFSDFYNSGWAQVGWLEEYGGTRITVVQWKDQQSNYPVTIPLTAQATDSSTYYTTLWDPGTNSITFQVAGQPLQIQPYHPNWAPTVAVNDSEATDSRNQMPGDFRSGTHMEVMSDTQTVPQGSTKWAKMTGTNSTYYNNTNLNAGTSWAYNSNPVAGEMDVADWSCPAHSIAYVGGANGDVFLTSTSSDAVGTDTGRTPKTGTSPSVATLSSGGQETAYQGSDGFLHVIAPNGTDTNTNYGMRPSTSPSIAASAQGGFEVAFQANTGVLWVYDSSTGGHNEANDMSARTSPSLAALSTGGYVVAFNAITGYLWLGVPGQAFSAGNQMATNTSPSIAGDAIGEYECAFQANTGYLWVWNQSVGGVNEQDGMAPATSPSLTGMGGEWQVAFQANIGTLWTGVPGYASNTQNGMATGTSPAITGYSPSSYWVAFQANVHTLWEYQKTETGFSLDQSMVGTTNPAIGS